MMNLLPYCRHRPVLRTRGFTLIEIMVVVVIMGILAALVVPKLMGRTDDARIMAAKQDIATIMQALKLYKLDNQRYPTTEQGLQALITAPAGVTNWNGPYWKKNTLPKDPWTNDYMYAAPGQHGAYDLWSYGADGKEGGDAINKDITSWE